MTRKAATRFALAAFAAVSVGSAPAEAAFPVGIPSAGFCVPAPDDNNYVPRTIKALGASGVPTSPIAILDTGVDPTVPQLSGRVQQGYDAFTGAPASGDTDGHGTQTAGVAAAAGPGVIGVAPAAQVLPIRVYDGTRATTAQALSKGIALAVQHGAKTISISGTAPLAGDSAASSAPAGVSAADALVISRAVDAAFAQGALVFAGAGEDNSAVPSVPGSLPHVLEAGSSAPSGARSSTTSVGPWLDVLAPGEGITSPLPGALCNQGFGFSSGTAFASAAYAAAGALIVAQRPGLTTQQYFELIRRAADDVGAAGRDDDTGFGALDVASGFTAALPAKETSAEPDDDPLWVRGPYAKTHPPLLTSKKLRFKGVGSVSPAKDPADVYPILLSRKERVVVSVSAADPNAVLELSIFGPKAGDFDVYNGVDRTRLVGTGGLSQEPQVELRAARSGLYYIAIEAPDAQDPEDPTASPPDLEPYVVSAFAQRPKAKKAKKR